MPTILRHLVQLWGHCYQQGFAVDEIAAGAAALFVAFDHRQLFAHVEGDEVFLHLSRTGFCAVLAIRKGLACTRQIW
ncbi:hypothetical protein D3C85_1411840 [compost metagenome]